jgi:hypothetical protein
MRRPRPSSSPSRLACATRQRLAVLLRRRPLRANVFLSFSVRRAPSRPIVEHVSAGVRRSPASSSPSPSAARRPSPSRIPSRLPCIIRQRLPLLLRPLLPVAPRSPASSSPSAPSPAARQRVPDLLRPTPPSRAAPPRHPLLLQTPLAVARRAPTCA